MKKTRSKRAASPGGSAQDGESQGDAAQIDGALNVFGNVSDACRALAANHPALKLALDLIGAPVIRQRTGGLEGLFRVIVEQQVAVPSAQAIWGRINSALDVADPQAIIAAGVDGLRAQGLSRPKAGYVVGLAETLNSGAFSFDALATLSDDEASAHLQAIKGVGPWTASIYLLFCDGRIDIWPPSDVALKAAFNHAREAVRSSGPLTQGELDARAADFAPYRGLAAHILWTYYAHIKGRRPI
ncbi:MAG: DNA-3-methyladenine glycosylase 2 family protein [Pseudomonadota bacterium]